VYSKETEVGTRVVGPRTKKYHQNQRWRGNPRTSHGFNVFLAVLLESIGNDHINGRCAGFDYGRVTHVLNPEAWRKNRRERNATGTGEVPGSGP